MKTLASKMAAIMGEVPTLIKGGTNTQQKYQFVTAEFIKAALRPLFVKHKIAIFSNVVELQRESVARSSGSPAVTVVAKMKFIIVCGDTGEKMECDWYGEAIDYGDKGVNKSTTAAEKYFLINTFMLSTTEPDSDSESPEAPEPSTTRQNQNHVAVATKANNAPNTPNPATTDQRNTISALFEQAGLGIANNASVGTWLKEKGFSPFNSQTAKQAIDYLTDQISREPTPEM